MRDVFATIARWLSEGRDFAAATLVATDHAGPATPGTTLAVDRHGAIAGNIGAGCFESDIIDACLDTIRSGSTRTITVSIDDELFGGTGCGASLHVTTWIPDMAFRDDALAIAAGDRSVSVCIPMLPAFTFTVPARAPLVIVGATDLAAEIATLARRLDYRAIVVDPRPVFATPQRLANADEIVHAWPDEMLPRLLADEPPVIIVAHDRKIDVPALECALRSNSSYIALLGSRRAQSARRNALRERGFSNADLDRIHGPAGLDLGGTSTAETALSILSELIAERNNRSAAPLRSQSGAIHGSSAVASIF